MRNYCQLLSLTAWVGFYFVRSPACADHFNQIITNMNNEMQEILNEIFEDEIYDMCDEIPQESICKKVSYAASQFGRGARTVMFSISGYLFKIVNCQKGFVSCSNPDETGLSNTCYKPFPNDGDHDMKECCKNLIEMMNESWYLCRTGGKCDY